MELAKAVAIGMASVVVCNTAHYSASCYYSQLATDEGLIGMSATTTPGAENTFRGRRLYPGPDLRRQNGFTFII